MASNAPAKCCTVGVKHEGQAKGQMKNIGNSESILITNSSSPKKLTSPVSTYFSYPESKDTSTAILILTDVIGHEYINAQLIADQFAANGYYVVMPDLFEGDPIPLNRPDDFDIMKWLTTSGPSKGHTFQQVDPIVDAVIKDMKQNQGVKKIGAVGYCFGAKYVARFMTGGKGVDVGYMAHPSFVDADEVKALTGPLSIAAAGESKHFQFTINTVRIFANDFRDVQKRTKSSPPRSAARRKTSSRT